MNHADWPRLMVPNYGAPARTLTRGQGSYVWDDQGTRHLDLLGGIAVNILGHGHPAIVAAVQEQVSSLAHTSNLYANTPSLELADRLHAATGMQTLFVNSGTEANEAAIKLMRRHAHAQDRPDGVILTFQGGFHGRTAASLAATDRPAYKTGTGPLPGQFVHVDPTDAEAVAIAFESHDIVGALIETLQGEGGVRPVDDDVVRTVAKQADAADALVAVDEVQAGLGRTGRLFDHQHAGIEPDIITLAKGLGGGLPLGAMLASPETASLLGPGMHGCTFGGNPVSCAAGVAVWDTIQQEDLIARAGQLGMRWHAAMTAHAAAARGRGLLLGAPHAQPAAVAQAMAEQGILVGVAAGAVRLAPALNVPEEAWMASVDVLVDAMSGLEPPRVTA